MFKDKYFWRELVFLNKKKQKKLGTDNWVRNDVGPCSTARADNRNGGKWRDKKGGTANYKTLVNTNKV